MNDSDMMRDIERNERLRAAAPDMLEALKALVTHPIVVVGTEDDTELASYVDVAHAAIAKATGETARKLENDFGKLKKEFEETIAFLKKEWKIR